MDYEQKKLVLEAVDKLKQGRADEALLVLQRMLHPKFRSTQHAYGALLMHEASSPMSMLHDHLAEALGHQAAA